MGVNLGDKGNLSFWNRVPETCWLGDIIRQTGKQMHKRTI